MLRGVLFDMDGVLLDSEDFITRAGVLMFQEKGFAVKPEDFKPFTGMGEIKFLGGVAEKYGISFDAENDKKRTYEIYGELVHGKLRPFSGVSEFINLCKRRKLKLAVATSADYVKMKINLHEIGFPETLFDSTVNGQEIERLKPAPDIFILAAKRLSLQPEECLVIEDAVSGVRAAKAAGSKALGITTSFTSEELFEADWTADNLGNVPEAAISW